MKWKIQDIKRNLKENQLLVIAPVVIALIGLADRAELIITEAAVTRNRIELPESQQ